MECCKYYICAHIKIEICLYAFYNLFLQINKKKKVLVYTIATTIYFIFHADEVSKLRSFQCIAGLMESQVNVMQHIINRIFGDFAAKAKA